MRLRMDSLMEGRMPSKMEATIVETEVLAVDCTSDWARSDDQGIIHK